MVHKTLIHITLKPHNKNKLHITREMKESKIKVPIKIYLLVELFLLILVSDFLTAKKNAADLIEISYIKTQCPSSYNLSFPSLNMLNALKFWCSL